MEPLRDPAAVGVKVIDKVQLPAAATVASQVFDSAKSPVVVIEEMASVTLPRSRSRTDCAMLVEPTACEGYCKEYGLRVTDGSDADPTFITKASVLPPGMIWKAVSVTGKSLESVAPAT